MDKDTRATEAASIASELRSQAAIRAGEALEAPTGPLMFCGSCGTTKEHDGSCDCPPKFERHDIERLRAS